MKINNLIARFLANKTTKEEWDTLESWKQDSKDNLNELLEMQSIWQRSIDLKDYKAFDAKSAWDAIDAQIEDEPQAKLGRRLLSLKWMGGIAAAITIVLFSTLTLFPYDYEGYNRIAAADIIENVELPDGSSIFINKNSELNYAVNFESNREIILDGEAYFDVARNEERPFRIKTDHADITVLGTSFNVYEGDEYVDILVTSGKVKVESGNEEITLTKNQMVKCERGKIIKIDLPSSNYLSWKTGSLQFNDVPLHRVVRDLNRHYRKNIVFSGESMALNQLVNDVFEGEDFESVLETLVLITGIKYHKEANKYVIE